ncbi:MAG TPA: hypothetical protein PKY82_10765 [Pyrinomonadaceae bacterium]|nr:hypothetical protein [Pyrinomonadaceae bacterium]
MLKKLLFIGLISSFLMACSAKVETNSNSNLASGSGNTANTTNTAANANTTPVSNNANVAAKPTVDNSPKRISFGKGANWGTANVTLAPNATQLFVVSAKSGQMMDIESSSKDVAINLRKGKAQTTEDFGYLNAELQSNGDYIFEVKNTSKKEVKTSIKVTIEGGNVKADEIDESDSTVKDDADVLPPPTKKKGN